MRVHLPLSLGLALVATGVLTMGAILLVETALPVILTGSGWAEIVFVGCILFVILGAAGRSYRRSRAARTGLRAE
jgi:hypothetical protein